MNMIAQGARRHFVHGDGTVDFPQDGESVHEAAVRVAAEDREVNGVGHSYATGINPADVKRVK